MDEALSVVGKRLPRVDGIEKATGEAKFTADLKFHGLLIGKILVSPHAHARVIKVDTSLAESLPGVKAVIWRKDAPRILWGTHSPPNCVWDQYTFDYRVRYKGEPVAAVAAVSEEIAEEALNLIKVEYEVLPAVFDVEEAIKENAPQLHADIGGVEVDPGLDDGNEGESFKVILLKRKMFEKHWQDFITEPAYDLYEEPLEIVGKA